jgi:hypothetical protein
LPISRMLHRALRWVRRMWKRYSARETDAGGTWLGMGKPIRSPSSEFKIARVVMKMSLEFGAGLQVGTEVHPFCPPGTGNSVGSCPEMSTRLCGSEAAGLLLASAPVQQCPSQSGPVTKPQEIFANEYSLNPNHPRIGQ